jgi:hypothetical protein
MEETSSPLFPSLRFCMTRLYANDWKWGYEDSSIY